MTTYQRTALACRLAALAGTGSTVWMAVRHEWILTVALGWGVFFLIFLGGRSQRVHLTDRARRERARRTARADEAALAEPVPCCSFWRHSDGAIHGPDCTRPRYAHRDDYRLDPVDQAAFEEITAYLDVPGEEPRSAA